MSAEETYRGFTITIVEPKPKQFHATINHKTRRLYTTVDCRSKAEARETAEGMVDWYFFDLVKNPTRLFEQHYSKQEKNNE